MEGKPEQMIVRRRKVLCVALMGLAALPWISGCRRGDRRAVQRTNLRYPLTMEPTTLDPAVSDSFPTGELLQNLYEGLVTLDAHSQVVPCLADRWEVSSDGRTYTFHLNPRAQFHAPYTRLVTAADVKYSLERTLWPETKSPVLAQDLDDIVGAKDVLAGRRRDLPGVSVVDQSTLTISTDRPRAYFLMDVAAPFVVCREALEKNGGKLDATNAIGTGPFCLDEYRSGSKVVLKANPSYYRSKPALQRIERPIVLDRMTAHVMFETGDLDMCEVALSDFANDMKSADLARQGVVAKLAGTDHLVMHPRLFPPFKDRRVCRAFAMAIDKETLLKITCHGLRQRADGFIPPDILGHDPSIHRLPFDPAAARALLAAAGYPGGKGFPELTLVYRENRPEMAGIAELVRRDLKLNLGVTVDLQEREGGKIGDDINNERLPFFLIGYYAADPRDFMSVFMRTGSKYNTTGYSNPAFDRLCDLGDQELNPQRRAADYACADQIALDDVAVLPICYESTTWLVKPYVKDLALSNQGLPHIHTRLKP